jgi:hypothetical protein
MKTLDDEVDASLREISARRKTKLTLVIAGLVLATGGMIALTGLMYGSDTGEIGETRIGSESFK